MNLLPAVLIGGPPHAGKSILACSLAQALRLRKCAQYLMRAAPDGEGDWACEADQQVVRDIRFKGQWNQRWIDIVCRDLSNRPLPLLVDVGGQPTPAQEAIFDQCTHAILLTKGDAEHAQWLAYARGHSLPIIADLHSDLSGQDRLDAGDTLINGTLAGLARGKWAKGPAFDALVDRLADLFRYTPDQLYQTQMGHAPFTTRPSATHVNIVHLDEIAQRLRGDHRFYREDLDAILERVPAVGPLALYGRAPIWLYVAIARRHNITWQFDIRLGWVQPPDLQMAPSGEQRNTDDVTFTLEVQPTGPSTLHVHISDYYLDYEDARQLRPPFVRPGTGLILDGRMPLWLATALAKTYRVCSSIDIIQPQERNRAANDSDRP